MAVRRRCLGKRALRAVLSGGDYDTGGIWWNTPARQDDVQALPWSGWSPAALAVASVM